MISAEKIKNLRIKTGAGMMDCKKALQEVNGDLESAVDWLRKKGISTAQKKADRSASDGLITVAKENNLACIVEINSDSFCILSPTCKLLLHNHLRSDHPHNLILLLHYHNSFYNKCTSILVNSKITHLL